MVQKIEMVTCPKCGGKVRPDNLESHLERVHHYLFSKPVPKIPPPTSPPGQSICPVCRKYFPQDKWRGHVRYCLQKQKKLAKQNDSSADVKLQPEPNRGHPLYIIDEFGVVQNYTNWIKNEMMGDHPLHQSSVVSKKSPRSRQRTGSKKGPSSKSTRQIDNKTSQGETHKPSPMKATSSPVLKKPSPSPQALNSTVNTGIQESPDLAELILRQVSSAETVPDGLSTIAKIERLAPPCPLCSKPVSKGQWKQHCKQMHFGVNKPKITHAYYEQKLRCGGCGKLVEFQHIKGHYLQTHAGWIVEGILINRLHGSSATLNQAQPEKIVPEKAESHKNIRQHNAEDSLGRLVDLLLDSINSMGALDDSFDEPHHGAK